MAFLKGAPGCCCCKHMYFANPSGKLHNLAKFDAPNLEWQKLSTDGFPIGGNYYHLDHYHNLMFDIGASSKIRSYTPKFPVLIADLTYTTVFTIGGSQVGIALTTVSEESKIIYVLRDGTPTTTRYVREVGFDGTGDVGTFNLTLNSSSDVIRQIEHCRADDRIYYNSTKSGDGLNILRACARDGTGNVIVFSPGSGIAVNTQNSFTFDNVREKIYAGHGYTGGGGLQSITRFDLDGSNQTEIYRTNSPISPSTLNRITNVVYSHKHDKVYWWQVGNLADGANMDTDDPKGGLWCCDHDGANPTQLTNLREIVGSSASTPLQDRRSLGCGYETLGTGTHA